MSSSWRKGSSKRTSQSASRPTSSRAHAPPPQGYPPDIKQSLDAVQKFTAACMARNCHLCQSKLTSTFSVKEWVGRWSKEAMERPENAAYLCAASCANCEVLTCLGCGRSPHKNDQLRQIDGRYVNWCCRGGRLLGMWVLLARYDQIELRIQSSSSQPENSSSKNRSSGKGAQDSKGVGYDAHNSSSNPWVSLFYDGLNGPPQALSRALHFSSMDKRIDGFVAMTLQAIQEMIPGPANKNLPPELRGMFQLSTLIDKVAELLRNDSLEDITSRTEVYRAAFLFVKKLGSHPELVSLVQTSRHHKQRTPGLNILTLPPSHRSESTSQQLVLGETIPSVAERLQKLAKQSDIVLGTRESETLTTRSGQEMLDVCEEISEVYAIIGAGDTRQDKGAQQTDKYETFHQEYCVTRDEDILTRNHTFNAMAMRMAYSPPGRMKRLLAEVANMATSLPVGIYVKVSESRPDLMRCLIMGPPDSPYGYGLFDFDLLCKDTYPQQPPLMSCRTASESRLKLNPNLHADGKVCLSLLGTWMDGDAAAQWQPGKSTILSVLISIQAMIFTEDPFRNEPAYTGSVGFVADMQAKQTIQKTQPRTIEYGMLPWLEQPRKIQGVWGEIAKTHFKLNRSKILANVDKWKLNNPLIKQRDQAYGGQSLYDRLQKTLGRFSAE